MKNRRSIRKPGHDYAEPGDYFVTVCVRNRDPLLGAVHGERVVLSALGLIVQQEWTDIPERFHMVRLDEFTIMPNHVHGIITIVGAPLACRGVTFGEDGRVPDALISQTGLTWEIQMRPALVCRGFGRRQAPPLRPRWVPSSVHSNPCLTGVVGRPLLRPNRNNVSGTCGSGIIMNTLSAARTN